MTLLLHRPTFKFLITCSCRLYLLDVCVQCRVWDSKWSHIKSSLYHIYNTLCNNIQETCKVKQRWRGTQNIPSKLCIGRVRVRLEKSLFSLLLHIVKLRVKVVCLNDERGLNNVNEAARKILRVIYYLDGNWTKEWDHAI